MGRLLTAAFRAIDVDTAGPVLGATIAITGI